MPTELGKFQFCFVFLRQFITFKAHDFKSKSSFPHLQIFVFKLCPERKKQKVCGISSPALSQPGHCSLSQLLKDNEKQKDRLTAELNDNELLGCVCVCI